MFFFLVWLFVLLLIGSRRSLYEADLTLFLFLRGYFFVPSMYLRLMTWLILEWFSILSTSWLCLYSLSKFGFIQILSCSFCIICNFYCKLYIFMLWWCWTSATIFYCMLFPYSWMGLNPWTSSSLLSAPLVLLANLLLANCFVFFCLSFSKWNPSCSSKMIPHGRNMFLCSTLFCFPSWLFSGCTSSTKLSSPLQSTIL